MRNNPLMQVAGLAGYLARRQMLQGEEQGELQQAGTLMKLQQMMQERGRATAGEQRNEALRSAIAALPPEQRTREHVLPLLLQHGALKEALPMMEKVEQPRGQSIGSGGLLQADGTVIPPAARPETPRAPAPSGLSTLVAERDAMPPTDPRRTIWDARIRKESETAKQITPPAPTANTEGTEFSKDALDLRAQQYLSGDPRAMANLGRGGQGSNRIIQITNRAAELLREKGGTPEEIGRRMAEFRANSNSLSKMTQSYDALTAFEQTAVRNGKILMDIADKADATGVPAIERWIRAGRKEIAGDVDVARFNAQLQVYRTEAARILTNPNLTGQLTDQARAEIETFLRPGASAAQIKGVVNLLERDFANRRQTLETQMRDIRTRLEKNVSAGETMPEPTPSPTPAPAPSPAAPQQFQDGQTATGPNGQKIIFKGGKWQPNSQ